MTPPDPDSGTHICLRASSMQRRSMRSMPRRSRRAASPTARRARGRNTRAGYYAAFVRDPDGNRIEAVTFMRTLKARHETRVYICSGTIRPVFIFLLGFAPSTACARPRISFGRMSSTLSATR